MPYTKSNGQAAYALDYQNEYMAARGTFWESGGDATLGASATDPIVNIGAVEVRIDDVPYSTGSETQVVLAENTGATPRKDLIVAEKPTSGNTADPPDVHAIAGSPIDETVYQSITDENGALVADPPALPEVQPPAGANLKGVAVPLHVVYVPPGTTDSTDLSNRGREDVRKEGVGVSDVLRSGDAVEEIEAYPNTVDASVTNSGKLGGKTSEQLLREQPNLNISELLAGGDRSSRTVVYLPQGKALRLWSIGSSAYGDQAAPTRAQMQFRESGDWRGRSSTDSTYAAGEGAEEYGAESASGWYSFSVINLANDQQTVEGRFSYTIEDL